MHLKFYPTLIFLALSFIPAAGVYVLGGLKESIEFYAAWQHLLIVLKEGHSHTK